MGVCLSVCLSVTSRCSIETDERIELVFGIWASIQPSYTVLKGNSVISKNKGTFKRCLQHDFVARVNISDSWHWFRTCRTSSFCSAAWQLPRFQLTRRIARSLSDSWASSTCESGICYGSASVCSRPIHLLLSQTGILQKWMIGSPPFCIEARPTLTSKFWTWKNLSAVRLLV